MKKLLILSFVSVTLTSCNAQEKSKADIAQNKVEPQKEEPKGTWKVEKEMDENGNIVRYDSIYSWSSSDNSRGLGKIDSDSLMQSFQSRFSQHFATDPQQDLSDFFGSDSLLMKQFFNDDFMDEDFSQGFPSMEKMRERMQAMMQQLVQRNRQPLVPAEPEENENSENQ